MNNIKDLIPDDKNFNQGTEKGKKLLDKSFKKFGAGRSILIDKNNKIIAGNKTFETYGEFDGQEVQIVESDGKRLIAVKRTDIDLDSKMGREMALADNRTSQELDWNIENLMESEIDINEWDITLPDLDFSEKNKELDFDDEEFGTIIFRFSSQDYLQILDKLNLANNMLSCKSNEELLKILLKDY